MLSDTFTDDPEYKRLRALMNDPRYWRDRDPAYVAMIQKGFEDMGKQGQEANISGQNGPVHAQDTEIAHLTPGEVVIPRSAQTPEIIKALYQVMGDELAKYVVGSGYEQVNPTSGLPAFADENSWNSWHFEDRDARNVNLPENADQAGREGSGWQEYPASQNKYHDNGIGKMERKFVHPDGREAVYDGDSGKHPAHCVLALYAQFML